MRFQIILLAFVVGCVTAAPTINKSELRDIAKRLCKLAPTLKSCVQIRQEEEQPEQTPEQTPGSGDSSGQPPQTIEGKVNAIHNMLGELHHAVETNAFFDHLLWTGFQTLLHVLGDSFEHLSYTHDIVDLEIWKAILAAEGIDEQNPDVPSDENIEQEALGLDDSQLNNAQTGSGTSTTESGTDEGGEETTTEATETTTEAAETTTEAAETTTEAGETTTEAAEATTTTAEATTGSADEATDTEASLIKKALNLEELLLERLTQKRLADKLRSVLGKTRK